MFTANTTALNWFGTISYFIYRICFSQYIPGEVVTTFDNGTVFLNNSGVHESILKPSQHRFACDEMWWSAQFGAHPRQILLSDRTGIAIYDIRVS